MDTDTAPQQPQAPSPIRKRLIAGAVAVGTVLGAAGIASAVTAQDDTPTDDPAPASAPDDSTTADDELGEGVEDDEDDRDELGEGVEDDDDDRGEFGEGADDDDDDHEVGEHRASTEMPLTGSVADQVSAAALAAVPGGTIDRVETDDHGAAYEAHMTDADGNPVTVTFDEAVNVVDIITGPGDEGRGHHGPGGHDEAPLTGTLADEVTAAAEAAVPGGTVIRVEQEGTGYEAHVTDADGAEVEVHFDANLEVIEIEQGH